MHYLAIFKIRIIIKSLYIRLLIPLKIDPAYNIYSSIFLWKYYLSLSRKDGSPYGEGQSVIMTHDGKISPWTAEGLGHFISLGTIRFRDSSFIVQAQLED